jgi:hypothetical protein
MAKVLKFGKNGPHVEETGTTPTATVAPPPDKQVMLLQLDELAGALLAGHHVLTTGVDPAQVGQIQPLVERYGTLQSRVLALITRGKDMPEEPATAATLAKDVGNAVSDTKAFLEAVEALATQHPRPSNKPAAALGVKGAVAPTSKRNYAPALVLGGTVLLVGVGSYLLWRKQQQAERAAVRQDRKLSVLPAPRAARTSSKKR